MVRHGVPHGAAAIECEARPGLCRFSLWSFSRFVCVFQAEAFGYPHELIGEVRDRIPPRVDVLLSHGPPLGVRDDE